MKITTLIDNTAPEGLKKEWGLSFYIEYGGRRYLLDTGASDKFLHNAQALGADIAAVDAAALSHAHYDHADGMDAFFEANGQAPFYIRSEAGEDCYGKTGPFRRYIGLPRGVLSRWAGRIKRVSGEYELAPGVWLIPHSTPGLGELGRRAHMYVRRGRRLEPDDFRHEQSLVFRTQRGLVVLNSCSHGGADNIIAEVLRVFPDERVYAYVGGLHLYGLGEERLRDYARRLAAADVPLVCTGHCTGEAAFRVLRESLGGRLHPLGSGAVIEI